MTDSIMNQPLLLRCAALLLLLVLGHQTVGASPPGKKFIELGWDIPTTADLRQHWRDMEQTTPFDGIMFRVEAMDEHSNRVSSESVWDAKPWKRDWLKPALEDLQACQFQRFKDNFVRFNATPGNLAWGRRHGLGGTGRESRPLCVADETRRRQRLGDRL